MAQDKNKDYIMKPLSQINLNERNKRGDVDLTELKESKEERMSKRDAEKRFEVEILKKAEIKRVNERLSKKELCNIYGLNYQFYMNVVSGRNLPSKPMIECLTEYLMTRTQDVYTKVFASREEESEFHRGLDIKEQEAISFISKLTEEGVYQQP